MSTQIYRVAADAVLLLHFGFVLFVVLSLPLIGLGGWLEWRFVRNVWFRAAHFLCIFFVAAESVTGIVCPLTTWENQLRLKAGHGMVYEGSFMQHWIHRVMFFEASERAFTWIYVVFLVAVVACFWWVKPQRRLRSSNSAESKSPGGDAD